MLVPILSDTNLLKSGVKLSSLHLRSCKNIAVRLRNGDPSQESGIGSVKLDCGKNGQPAKIIKTLLFQPMLKRAGLICNLAFCDLNINTRSLTDLAFYDIVRFESTLHL